VSPAERRPYRSIGAGEPNDLLQVYRTETATPEIFPDCQATHRTFHEVDLIVRWLLSAQKWGGGLSACDAQAGQCDFSDSCLLAPARSPSRRAGVSQARAGTCLCPADRHRVVGAIVRSRRLTLKTNSNHSTPILRIAALRPNSLNRNSQEIILLSFNGDLSRAHSSMASMRSIFTRCWHQGLSNFGAEEAWRRCTSYLGKILLERTCSWFIGGQSMSRWSFT